MNPETEKDSPTAGRNGRDGSYATITYAYETTSKSSAINGIWGRGQGGHTRRGGHQGHDGQGRHFNRPAYTS